jgi:hypothetical protein
MEKIVYSIEKVEYRKSIESYVYGCKGNGCIEIGLTKTVLYACFCKESNRDCRIELFNAGNV